MEKLHLELFPRHAGEHYDPFSTLVNLLFHQTGLGITIQEVRFCFGMSKMTVKDEVIQRHEYDTLRWSEFVEFLARLAHARYTDDDLRMDEKLYRLLDAIFKVYGMRVKSPEEAN